MARFPRSGLRALVEGAQEFSEAHPALAGWLGRASRDPPVERFRQALFYLGATLLERSRHFEAEGYRALSELVAPDLGRPFPAATIVELSAPDAAEARHIAAGAEVRTHTGCIFRLVSDVELGPFRAQGARLSPDNLEFELAATGNASLADAVGDRLRVYVDGPRESALAIVEHLLRHAAHVELTSPGQQPRKLGPVSAFGLRPEDALAPEPDGPPTGARFLVEYFLLPQKFAFFEVAGIREALRGTPGREAAVTIRFDAPMTARASLGGDDLRVHCAPASNLFRATSEPRIVDPSTTSFPVRVAGFRREQASVYAVTSVSATPYHGAGSSTVVPPLRRFAVATPTPEFPYAFSTRLETFDGRAEPDVILSITSPRGAEPLLERHVLMLDVWATNRARANELRPGDALEPGPGMLDGVKARSLLSASPYVPPPSGPEFALHALARGAVPRADPLTSLQSLLFTLVPRRGVDPALVRANLARVRAIETLRVAVSGTRAHRGYRASLALDESAFRGAGDVGLFVRILQVALDAQASVNRFYECEATCKRSATTVLWPRNRP